MARQEVQVGGGIRFIKAKDLADAGINGDVVLRGTYLGDLENNFDANKKDYKFEDTEGNTVIVNGTGSLAAAMKAVDPGSLVEIEYHGKVEMTSGKFKGTQAHQYKVFLDLEDGASA